MLRSFCLTKLRNFRTYVFVQTVVETPAYLSAAEDAGLTEAERSAIVTALAKGPDSGDAIQGTGGCRKVRIAGRGKGKSGGYPVITFFTGQDIPVFLLTVFSKGERADLTAKERNALRGITKDIVAGYRDRVKGMQRR